MIKGFKKTTYPLIHSPNNNIDLYIYIALYIGCQFLFKKQELTDLKKTFCYAKKKRFVMLMESVYHVQSKKIVSNLKGDVLLRKKNILLC